MELNNLSSNWKKLQSKLQKQETSHIKKRKVEAHLTTAHDGVVKRRKQSLAGEKQALKVHGEQLSGNKMGDGAGSVEPAPPLAVWAEDNDIPVSDLAKAYGTGVQSAVRCKSNSEILNQGLSPTAEAGKYIAMDCEMVGVGGQGDDERSVLARVSVVNYHGEQVYDSFVKPREPVTNWRTPISGIRPSNMISARDFETVQKDIARLLQGRILVGHSVHHDLDALFLSHPRASVRDTSRHPTYRGQTPALKMLAEDVLGVEIQNGEHSSVEDARVCMLLYRQHKDGFERKHSTGRQSDTLVRKPDKENVDGDAEKKAHRKNGRHRRKTGRKRK